MEDKEIVAIICGKPTDHKCDSLGPCVYWGDNVEPTTDRSKAGRGYTNGSVTCSKCGISAMEVSLWRDE